MGEQKARLRNIGRYFLPARRFHSKRFTAGVIQQILNTVLIELDVDPDEADISLDETLFNGAEHERSIELDDTDGQCELEGKQVSIRCHDGGGSLLSISLEGKLGGIIMLASGQELGKAQQLADRVAHLLDLKEAPEPLTEGELALRRVEALERLVAPLRDRLSCFLSYRFTKEVEPLAAKLQKFLALMDIDVTTGAAYEPRPIVEKVKDRLGLNHGFVVFGNLDPRGIDVDERRN